MAEKRMFSKSIVLSDEFLDMPATARCLYFTLGMFADDDGFVNNPRSIMRQCMSTTDDLKILLGKEFLIGFDSGIVVIRHWRINNYLRRDRYTPTKFVNEKAMLYIDETGAYGKIHQEAIVQVEPSVKAEPLPDENESIGELFEIEDKAETEKAKPEEKKKRVPLVEREPKNDIETVEKVYLLNYNRLHSKGVLRSPVPVLNWQAGRRLVKDCIKKYGVSVVCEAVRRSSENEFCVSKGYALTTILSGGVLAQLINGGNSPPRATALKDKYDISELIDGG